MFSTGPGQLETRLQGTPDFSHYQNSTSSRASDKRYFLIHPTTIFCSRNGNVSFQKTFYSRKFFYSFCEGFCSCSCSWWSIARFLARGQDCFPLWWSTEQSLLQHFATGQQMPASWYRQLVSLFERPKENNNILNDTPLQTQTKQRLTLKTNLLLCAFASLWCKKCLSNFLGKRLEE